MPLFTRRRLQSMLNEIAPRLGSEKARDLLARLEDKRVDQVLPAEIELGLLWGLSKIGSIDIEPDWWGDERRPDAYSESFVVGEPAAIEIAAPTDNAISGEEAMDRIALKIGDFASRATAHLGDHLYYRFQEESGYDHGIYFRRRLTPIDWDIGADTEAVLRDWIESGRVNTDRLRIIEPGLDVEVEKTAHKQTRYHNTWSTMPPETHSVEDNPLYKLLVRKAKQLRAALPGTHRFIFLGDAGSSLLNRLGAAGEMDPTHRRVSGRQILSHFVVENARSVDAIVVFAPVREGPLFGKTDLRWRISVFARPNYTLDMGPLDTLGRLLPQPRFEGYQARSLFRQGAYSPNAKGWWLGMSIRGLIGGPMEVKVSSRALVDLLAGRIDADQFRRAVGQRPGEKNPFEHWLNTGFTLQDVKFEAGGVDEDDDRLVLTLDDDPSARRLRIDTASPANILAADENER